MKYILIALAAAVCAAGALCLSVPAPTENAEEAAARKALTAVARWKVACIKYAAEVNSGLRRPDPASNEACGLDEEDPPTPEGVSL